MFAQERYDKIMEILHKEGKLIAKDLSNKSNVTEDCIRKNLKLLEKNGFLQRTYGGAVPLTKSAPNEAIELRRSINIPSKQIIAKKVVDIINENETIFFRHIFHKHTAGRRTCKE
ncbi:DeoR family transcriptional regulator [Clostridium pasteurianum]|uniref:DeoR family transcriptional regulator n=1 Tax=Clostridium pasteurianum TaxID=1501 RepID=UPI001FA85C23|nr:DeoR family transcriptional regulator [Clostridium pasteurianum]